VQHVSKLNAENEMFDYAQNSWLYYAVSACEAEMNDQADMLHALLIKLSRDGLGFVRI
jgi:hypothetical protein